MISSELFSRVPLIVDGAPGDWLRRKHPALARPVEALNLRKPEWVRAAHAEFMAAGAQVLRTNTRHADALSLARHELHERCEAIVNSGVACVREAGGTAVIAGCIGEISQAASPGGPSPYSAAEREQAYGQQAVYLSDTGCDLVLLEGFFSVEESLRVLRVVRNVGDAPVLGVLALDDRGRTGDGVPIGSAAQRLVEAGMDAVGLLCGPNAEDVPRWVREAKHAGAPVAALLSAFAEGSNAAHADPAPAAGTLTPEAFAQRMAGLAADAALLGGGAGIGPAHIRALCLALGRG
jgi:methionine synthase I (cobalamin-dependent)